MIVGGAATENVPVWLDVFVSLNVSVDTTPGDTVAPVGDAESPLLFVAMFVKVGAALIVVLSGGLVAALPAFVCVGSPPPATDAVFVIAFVPVGVPDPTFTATVMALPFVPAAIAVLEVHVIAAVPAPVHVQPVPMGLPFAVRPFGSVSLTVIVPEVAAFPAFFGVIV